MFWLGLVPLAVWAWLLAFRGGFWRLRGSVPPRLAGPAPVVAAVVPARDEAGLVGRCVASLARQRGCPPARIFVVDDHSGDATAAEARAAGDTVVSARPLPPGWTGKLWAVSEGLEPALALDPEYVLLTDADVVHSRDSLAGLVAQAEAGDYDLVSLMVRLHCSSAAERMLIPAFVFFFLKLYPPRWTADARRRTAGAAGGCILLRTRALARIGGIASIRGEPIDDCALAAAVKGGGGRVWMGLAGDTESVRAYSGCGEIRRLIARTAFTQLRYSTARLALTLGGMALLYAEPPLAAVCARGYARWTALAAWALMTAAYLPAIRFYRLSPLWALSLPGAACFYSAATVESAVRHWRGRGGEWKGRAAPAAKVLP